MSETIFFSWQSDTELALAPIIRKSLRRVSQALAKKTSIGSPTVKIDEATRDLPGSPNIADSIREKIRAADVFVADVTLINAQAERGSGRSTPNPNVMFELGFAVAELGWARIILLFNERLPMKADDLPFDIRANRASPFRGDDSAGLNELLTIAIGSIVLKAPARPDNSTDLSPEVIKKDRDLRTLRAVLSCIDMSVIDVMLEKAPSIIVHEAFHHYEGLNGVVSASTFGLYDQTAQDLIVSVRDHWGGLLSFGVHYTDLNTGDYKFKDRIGSPLTGSIESDWEAMEEEMKKLKETLDDLIDHVRRHFLELDLEALSELARKERITFYEETFQD